MAREQLVSKLNELQLQEKELRKQIDALDYDGRFADAKQYEGRYFKEVERYHRESVRCLFVYDTDKTNCEPKAVCISYWKTEDTHFQIEYYSHFNPKKWEEDDKWEEISKEEFEQHYKEALQRVEQAINAKNNVS